MGIAPNRIAVVALSILVSDNQNGFITYNFGTFLEIWNDVPVGDCAAFKFRIDLIIKKVSYDLFIMLNDKSIRSQEGQVLLVKVLLKQY